MCEPLADRPDLIEALRQEIKHDWERAYHHVVDLLRQMDHELRNERNKAVILLHVLAELRDNPTSSELGFRVDRLLGRGVGDE
jgi:hypothetical protein